MSSVLPPRARLLPTKVCADAGFAINNVQRMIFEAAERPGIQKVVVAAGIRATKSTAAAWWLLARCLSPTQYPPTQPIEAFVVAPTHALSSRIFDMVCRLYQAHYPELVQSLRQVDGVLTCLNLAGSTVIIRRLSAERPASLIGFSADYMAVDEAALLSEEVFDNLLGRLIDRRGESFWVSSPRGTSNPFARLFREGQRGGTDVASVQCPSWANENLPRDEIKKMRARMSAISFAQDVGGEFVSRSGKVFSGESVDAVATLDAYDPIEPGQTFCAGLDLGISHDASVMTVMRYAPNGKAVVAAIEVWARTPWPDQIARVKRIADKFGCRVRVDATGIGNAVCSMLQDAGVEIIKHTFTPASKHSVVQNAVAIIEKGGVTLPARSLCPQLYDELVEFSYLDADDTGGDFKKTGAPPGQHDDTVVSLCLALAFFRPGGEVEGRAIVNGVNRIPEPEAERQKAEVKEPAMRPKTAAQLEAERMVRALYPEQPKHDDGEPDRPGITPRARPGFSSGIWDPAP